MARRASKRTASQFLTIDLDAAEFVSLKEVFRSLPDAMRRQVLKPIVDKVAKVGAQVAKQTAARMLPPRVSNPNRYSGKPRWNRPTGALRDSLGAKTIPLSKMRDKNKVVGMFGARRDFRVSKQTMKRASAIGMKVQRPNLMQRKFRIKPNPFIVPSRYIHLWSSGIKEARITHRQSHTRLCSRQAVYWHHMSRQWCGSFIQRHMKVSSTLRSVVQKIQTAVVLFGGHEYDSHY
jgi:hypothetical protein